MSLFDAVLARVRLLEQKLNSLGGGGGATDHGALTGLADDDHTQYLKADGTRTLTGNLTVTGTVDGRDVATDGTKLDGIESGAEVNDVASVHGRTGAVTGVASDYAVFSGSTNGFAPGPTGLAIGSSAYFVSADGIWRIPPTTSDAAGLLSGVLDDARVQESNVTQHEAALDHGGIAGLADDDHTQYLLADGTRTLTGNLTVTGTVDGRDVATDGTKLDGIEAGAEVNGPLGVWAGGKTSGTQAIATLADATLDAEDVALTGISLASNVLTLANAGTYVVMAQLSYSKTTANANCAVQLLLAHDLGAGYTYPLRAFASGHVRVSGTKGGCSLVKTIVTTSSNEKIKFQHRDTLSGGNVNMDAQGLQVTVLRIS